MFYLFVEKGEGEFFKKNAPLYYVQNIYMSNPFYLIYIYIFFLIFHFFNLYFKTSKMRRKKKIKIKE